jgi:hypothetical protein
MLFIHSVDLIVRVSRRAGGQAVGFAGGRAGRKCWEMLLCGVYTGFSWLDVGTVTNSWEGRNTLPDDIKCRDYLDKLSYYYLLKVCSTV